MTAATIYRVSIVVGLLLLAFAAHCWRVRYRRDLDAPGGPWGGFVLFLALCLWSSGAWGATRRTQPGCWKSVSRNSMRRAWASRRRPAASM